MLIAGVIGGLLILGISMKKYDSRFFAGVIIVIFSILYLLFEPTAEFDLYRHYEIYDIIKDLSLREALAGNQSLLYNTSGLLYNIYAESSPVYILLVFLLSRFFPHKAIIVFSILIVYGVPMYIMRDIGRKNNIAKQYINLSYVALLFLINFVDVSGIRNTMASSLVFLAVYSDVYKKRRNIGVIAIYIMSALIHNSVLLVIAIRLLLLIKQKFLRRILTGVLFFSVPLVSYLQSIGFSFGGGMIGNFLNYTLAKLNDFIIGGGSSVNIISTATVVINYCIRGCGILVIYLVYSEIKKRIQSEKYGLEEYGHFAMYFFAFSISSVTVYDMFVRLQYFAVFMGAALLPIYMEKAVGKRITCFKGIRPFAVSMCVAIVVVGYFITSYRWMDSCFF